MSDETTYVTVPEMSSDNAVLLLAAAEAKGYAAEVVRSSSDGFVVPEDVFKKSGIKLEGDQTPAPKKSTAKAKE